ncbi:RNA-directed DNA polymerase [Fulvivirga sp. M361]|uniref:antiviral reverse transcriptase Drt3a n=1 Tax=Fulvivirga sp. M361 TaxID=2594266 RepID=UPI00117BB55D|nr:antiviral reverse transcriptase Drt3a [Fulvivirga sp. M361]TRX45358.1 RNA-directed DNA polymerase [Fulvivirga sp. M361]
MNQNYSSQQLIKLCKPREWDDYGLSMEELIYQIDDNFSKVVNGSFLFDIKQVGDYYLTHELPQKLIIRKLNENIKRLYKDKQANRRVIIKQVRTLLAENGPMWILRTDIEKFYESINRERLLLKLRNDSMLSFHSQNLLDKLFQNSSLIGSTGLPRGLNISATLSELYMRNFDKWVRRSNGVYFYARFVDDIIIFSNSEKVINDLNRNINRNLEKGLNKKLVKTGVYRGDNIKVNKPLEYLGYQFTTETIKNKKTLTISIANKKIKKIKSRITLSLLDFIKNENFALLENRIKFLTGNFSVRKNSEGNDLKAGIYYNYSHITNFDIFDDLNLYLRKTLYSKYGSFGLKLSSKLNNSQRQILASYSFKHGYFKKVFCPFSVEEILDIKDCWR